MQLTKTQAEHQISRLRKAYKAHRLPQDVIDLLSSNPNWAWEQIKRKTTEQFKTELAQVNPVVEVLDKYKTARTLIRVHCRECGCVWRATPSHLLHGTGCPKCAGNAHKTTKQFVSELKEINPDIDVLGEYINAKTHIKSRCEKCGLVWAPKPDSLLQGIGCPRCAGHMCKTTQKFKEQLKVINPSVEVVGKYTGADKHIDSYCKVCGYEWSPTPNHLLHGTGCPKCAGKAKRAVVCVETGEVYPSQTAAAYAKNLKGSASISRVLLGQAKTAAGYHWAYVNDGDKKDN